MKKLLLLIAGLSMLVVGCNDTYDDSELVKRMDEFEQRLQKLEQLCNSMNTNLSSIQGIVTSLEKGGLHHLRGAADGERRGRRLYDQVCEEHTDRHL